MDFIKELLQLQQEKILIQISEKLRLEQLDKDNFIMKYNKRNYCLVKVCNCKIKETRVQIKDLLSTLECDHNPSLRR